MKVAQLFESKPDYNDESKWPAAVKKFDKWVSGPGDLWHPAFPDRFAQCLSTVFKTQVDDVDLDQLGTLIADHMNSFYGSYMMELIDYIKQHPLPEDEDELEAYVLAFKKS